jgi:hypothetical protein
MASNNAILITGQFRTLDKIVDSLRRSIIAPNHAVVFVCCETDVDEASVRDVLLSNTSSSMRLGGLLTAPTFRTDEFLAILTMIRSSNRPGLSEQVFERARQADGLYWHYGYVESSGSILQYYQFWKIWNVLLDYERTHGCKFDNIVRARTDIFINHPINVADVFEMGGFLHDSYLRHALQEEPSVYMDPFTTDIASKNDTIVTLGQEQIWIGSRSVFDRLSQLVFHYGLYDSGASFAFNSESQFHCFCRHHGIYHIGIVEKNWPVYFTAQDDKFLFGIVRG